MDSLKNRMLGAMQNKLGQFSVCARIAVKLRNQLDAIIASHLNDGIDMYLNGELWLIDSVAPKAKVFFDVGANTGVWSKLFLSKMPKPQKGLLFEPSPLAVRYLKSNLKLGIQENFIKIIQAAVCDQSGQMDFFMEESAGETSSLIKKHSKSQTQKITVKTTTIDSEVLNHDLGFIDFIKIDAEGYDLHVLRGAEKCLSEKNVGVIQFEYNKPWANSSSTLISAIEYLNNHGYEVYLLKKNGLYDFRYEIYGEYFRYSNFVAIAPGYLDVNPLCL